MLACVEKDKMSREIFWSFSLYLFDGAARKEMSNNSSFVKL